MRPAFIAFWVGALALLSPPLPAQADTTGSVAGHVTDESTGAPIAGATIELRSPSDARSTTTDVKGYYVVLCLPPSTYGLTITRPGYQAMVDVAPVIQGEQTLVNFQMPRNLKVVLRDYAWPLHSLVNFTATADKYVIRSGDPFYDSPGMRQYLFNGIPGILMLGGGVARPF